MLCRYHDNKIVSSIAEFIDFLYTTIVILGHCCPRGDQWLPSSFFLGVGPVVGKCFGVIAHEH